LSITRYERLNSGLMQEHNRSLTLRTLRQLGLCSRAQLAAKTGLTQGTITNIANDFIQRGVIQETGNFEGKRGRRAVGISLNSERFNVIVVRLTRKNVFLGVFDLAGTELQEKRELLSIEDGSEGAVRKIKDVVTGCLSSQSKSSTVGIGFAIPGPYLSEEGRIALMTEFPGWERIQIKKEFESAFDIPVYFELDANAGALAEWWLGPYRRDQGSMLYVAAGQGVGAGLVIDGQVLHGALGIAGGIGHMSINCFGPKCACGNRGCLEMYCSSTAIVKNLQHGSSASSVWDEPDEVSFNKAVTALAKGDPVAVSAFREAARYLGMGLVNMINGFNPHTIIIGDDLAQGRDLVLSTVRDTVAEHVLPEIYQGTKIELSEFREDPVLLGICSLVIDNVFQRPSTLEALAHAGGKASETQSVGG
jgi:N-acetylglucosamine repressor